MITGMIPKPISVYDSHLLIPSLRDHSLKRQIFGRTQCMKKTQYKLTE